MRIQNVAKRYLFLSLSVALVIFAAGCASKKTSPDGGMSDTAAADENASGDSDSGKAMGLQTIHFPYDSFALDAENKERLKANTEILKANPSLKVQIEGHCDQRGGIQYNIALGEKRANSVKKYMEDMGVQGDRLTVISFGKERVADQAMTEDAFAKNRRANFVITSR